MKTPKKNQTFCGDCGFRLSDSIYAPALSRKNRDRYPSGNLKPKKYVCHDCGVIQAMSLFVKEEER
jgi:hypothetical protein